MFNLWPRSKSDDLNVIPLSKMKKEDILLLQYNENIDILYDFNNLGFFQIRRLKNDIYPIIKDSTNPKIELLARTIYSLSKLKIKCVEAYFNKRLLFCERCQYVATIEKNENSNSELTKIEINIYPFSDQCLPCYKIVDLKWGIVPLRKMYIDEMHRLIEQCKSLQEFKQHFDFYITYPHKGDKNLIFDNQYQLDIVYIILNGINYITLGQAENYIRKFNMNFEAIKSEIKNKLFERLRTNIDKGKWGTLIDMKLLRDYSTYDESYLIAYPDKIKETFKNICEVKGGIII
jgi:hypothetical protein